MSRWEITEANCDWTSFIRGFKTWIVLEDGRPIYVSLYEDEARSFLSGYKAQMAATCDHPTMKATIEGPDMLVTAECIVCGIVGETRIDVDDLTWVGQQ
jgi:hypothetical protein